MAIVKMSKIKLLGLINNKEDILNTLLRSGCVEICDVGGVDNMERSNNEGQNFSIQNNYERIKKVIDYLTSLVEICNDKSLTKDFDKNFLNNFFVSCDEFLSILANEQNILNKVLFFEDIIKEFTDLNSEKTKLTNLITQLNIFADSPYKFTDFHDTFYTKTLYGTIKEEFIEGLINFSTNKELINVQVISKKEVSIVAITYHKRIEEEVLSFLNEIAFQKCQFDFDMTAKDKIKETERALRDIEKQYKKNTSKIFNNLHFIREIKILSDRYKFELEKIEDDKDFLYTKKTFLIQGYIPSDEVEQLKTSLSDISNAFCVEISEPNNDDTPPTLVKNSKVIRQTEFITDMYSVPNYREMDPSKVIFFFFMLFMGLIMADVGYGILMVFLGVLLARKIKVDNGTRRLWYIIAIGGISTIIFGLLFDSFFGISFIGYNVLPNPNISNGGTTENIYVMLLLCLGLGIVQIAVGYLCKAINEFMQGKILDGFFDGIVWVLFFIGLIFAGFNFILNYFNVSYSDSLKNVFNSLEMPGLILLAVALVVATISAGRYEKGFGKFSKGFGAVYGLINIMSDILSYARLFGLMLSGMIIASTFNTMGADLIVGGGIGIVLGVLVIIVGHAFNLAMGVLGAYIHDSRLQYIEFFGKFYTGEGRKFTPFGSQTNYIYLTNN